MRGGQDGEGLFPLTGTDLARFEAKFVRNSDDECWPWVGAKIHDGFNGGYGRMRVGHLNLVATRISWLHFRGTIPDGMLLCHHCDNPPCVNPAHLFLGSYSDNAKDMIAKGRARLVRPGVSGDSHPATKLPSECKADIVSMRGRADARYIAEKYGVSVELVRQIWRRDEQVRNKESLPPLEQLEAELAAAVDRWNQIKRDRVKATNEVWRLRRLIRIKKA